jgi:hypothetical protein
MSNITKSNILTYIINLLLESKYYIKFNSLNDKQNFNNYIWESYEDYNKFINTKKNSEINLYKEKYIGFDIFDNELNYTEQLKSCLFIDATEYSFRNNLQKMVFSSKNNSINHWLLRIGNGKNFKNSSKFNIWGVKQTNNTKNFEKLIKKGDILWFIISKNNGQAIAFAEYINHNERTKTNEELGWEIESNSNNWTIEINYKNLTNIEDKNYYTHILGQNVNIRIYNDKCKINLPQIFENLLYDIEIL